MISVFPSYTIAGFIAAALVLIPLPRQIRAGNIAMIALIFWFFQHCLAVSVNTIIWRGNVNNVATTWCDITTTLREGSVIALPACTLCVCKNLELISSRRPITALDLKLRRTIFELIMCFGIPAFWIFIGYCFKGYRYVIIEDFGCYASFWGSNAYVIAVLAPTLGLAVATLVYGVIALYHLSSNHRTNTKILTPHLKSRDSALSGAQYYRLMIMGMILGLWGVVWISLEIQAIVAQGISPLPNWNVMHRDNRIPLKFPTSAMIKLSRLNSTLLLWWGIPGAAYLYFVLFGASLEVLAEYPKLWLWVRTKVLRLPPPVRSGVSLMTFTMPQFRTALTHSLPIHIDTTTVISDDLESKGEKVSHSHSFHSNSEAVN